MCVFGEMDQSSTESKLIDLTLFKVFNKWVTTSGFEGTMENQTEMVPNRTRKITEAASAVRGSF